METFLGVLVVAAGGFIMGSGAWPIKLMKKYKFEHWWFVGMLVGLVVMPWAIVLLGCPGAIEGLLDVPGANLRKANIFAFGWGIANVLCALCFVRIGIALTGAILAGLGASVGMIVPLVFKGSGQFEGAPDLWSPAGRTILVGVGIMLGGVVFASLAGFGRDRALGKSHSTSGSFLGGLIMTIVAGILSSGTAFTFVYAQEPIVSRLSWVQPGGSIKVRVKGEKEPRRSDVDADGNIQFAEVGTLPVGNMRALDAAGKISGELGRKRGGPAPEVNVETGSIPANFGVWAVGLAAGALVNLGYTAWLLTKNRSWGVLLSSGRELALAVTIGISFSLAVALMGKGMLLLGPLGGSIGFGIQQAMQMTGSQAVGFLSGEWRGVRGRPLWLMGTALAVLVAASAVLAHANTMAS